MRGRGQVLETQRNQIESARRGPHKFLKGRSLIPYRREKHRGTPKLLGKGNSLEPLGQNLRRCKRKVPRLTFSMTSKLKLRTRSMNATWGSAKEGIQLTKEFPVERKTRPRECRRAEMLYV